MIPVSQAIKIVLEHSRPLPSEAARLSDAVGRFLTEEVVSDSDLPPFDRSQMDGYALKARDTENAPAQLTVVGESAAGRGWHNVLHSGQAVRIMTGAPVPEGADSVQQVELTREDGACVEILQTVAEGRSIVRRGSEISAGETVLRAGDRISAGSIATLASFGYHSVQVGRQPRVAVLATGSELVPVDRQPAKDQIRDSNNYSIEAYAKLAGAIVERLPLIADHNEDLKTVIAGAASHSDVVITSGGVSMGVYDFTKTAFRELGAEIYFERVALRPGKPTVFGKLPNGTLLFGLPGNPVSVSVTFILFTQCCLLALQGAAKPELHYEWAILDSSVKSSPDRDSYLPATLTTNEHAQQIAVPLKWGGSSDFVSFAGATALIVIPARSAAVQGTHVQVVRLA